MLHHVSGLFTLRTLTIVEGSYGRPFHPPGAFLSSLTGGVSPALCRVIWGRRDPRHRAADPVGWGAQLRFPFGDIGQLDKDKWPTACKHTRKHTHE